MLEAYLTSSPSPGDSRPRVSVTSLSSFSYRLILYPLLSHSVLFTECAKTWPSPRADRANEAVWHAHLFSHAFNHSFADKIELFSHGCSCIYSTAKSLSIWTTTASISSRRHAGESAYDFELCPYPAILPKLCISVRRSLGPFVPTRFLETPATRFEGSGFDIQEYLDRQRKLCRATILS